MSNRRPPGIIKQSGDVMPKKILIICLFIVTANFLTACWSQKELTDIAFVVALGIDKNEKGDIVATLQVVNPKNVAGSSRYSGGQGPPVTIYTGYGRTILEATREAIDHISRILYYSHTNLVVISEDLAKEGVIELFDALERIIQIRITAKLVIARQTTAEEFLQILAPIDQIPATKIIKILDYSERFWGRSINTNVGNFIDEAYLAGADPVVTGFIIEGDREKGKTEEGLKQAKVAAQILTDAIGIFKDGKLVGWAEEDSARGILWVRGKVRNSAIAFDWKEHKKAFSYRVMRTKSKVEPQLKNGKPSFHIHIDTEGNLAEVHVPIDLSDPDLINELEKSIEKKIKQEVLAAVQLSKEKKSDFLMLGNKLRVHYPKYWTKHLKEWRESILPDLDVSVSVHSYIRRTESRIKPYYYEMKEN